MIIAPPEQLYEGHCDPTLLFEVVRDLMDEEAVPPGAFGFMQFT